jgi:hypothetical protein
MANANTRVPVQMISTLQNFQEINNYKWASIFHNELATKIKKNYMKPLCTSGAMIAVNVSISTIYITKRELIFCVKNQI